MDSSKIEQFVQAEIRKDSFRKDGDTCCDTEVPVRTISGFVLKEKLAEGNYGTVHRCEKDGETFACKIISKREPSFNANEIDALRLFDHPNIVKPVHVEESREELFIIMEMMAGGELTDHILRRETLNESEASSIIRQVASGLADCHQMNLLHRDLKPENLLLARKGSTEEVKIADFGLATIVPFEGASTRNVVGSPGYLAPEIRQGKHYTTAVDIWALGVILYVMLFGYMPFDTGKDSFDSNADLEPYYTLDFVDWHKVSPSARALLERMLHYDQAERPTAAEICTNPWVLGAFRDSGSPSPSPREH